MKIPESDQCQFVMVNGCHQRADWVVQMGTRESDRTRVCGKHLHRACQAFLLGQDRALTVRPHRTGRRS
jgi:hypothetical protein